LSSTLSSKQLAYKTIQWQTTRLHIPVSRANLKLSKVFTTITMPVQLDDAEADRKAGAVCV
jgi:hypothetical protein